MPEGAVVPPTPLEPQSYHHVRLPRASVAKMRKLRKTLPFDEADGGETMEIEDDDSDTDVSMAEIDDTRMDEGNSQRPNLPLAPVIMAVKAISVIMGELVHTKCIGCRLGYFSQKDHEDCTWLPWPDMVEKYFDQALANLTPKKFFDFAGSVYNFRDLFENEQDYCIGEAIEFFHFELKMKEVQLFVKEKLKKSATNMEP